MRNVPPRFTDSGAPETFDTSRSARRAAAAPLMGYSPDQLTGGEPAAVPAVEVRRSARRAGEVALAGADANRLVATQVAHHDDAAGHAGQCPVATVRHRP